MGFSTLNQPFCGTPKLGNPHMWLSSQKTSFTIGCGPGFPARNIFWGTQRAPVPLSWHGLQHSRSPCQNAASSAAGLTAEPRHLASQNRPGLSGSTAGKNLDGKTGAKQTAEKGLPEGEWHRKGLEACPCLFHEGAAESAFSGSIGRLANQFWEWEALVFILAQGFQYSSSYLTTYP